MALAFFTTPTLPSLASFGLTKTTQESPPPASLPSSDSNLRPVSASAGAIIKCSDCGGDVPLVQLSEHVCSSSKPTSASAFIDSKARPDSKSSEPPDKSRSRFGSQSDNTTQYPVTPRDSAPKTPRYLEPQNDTTPKPSKSFALSANKPAAPASFASSAREKLINRARSNSSQSNSPSPPLKSSKTLPQAAKDSSSEFSLSNSDSSFSTQSSNSKIPFFERYAQLVPKPSALGSSNGPSDSLESPTDDWKLPSSDNYTDWPAKNNKQAPGSSARTLKTKKVVTPITSPEPSPSEGDKFGDWYQPYPNNSQKKLPGSSSMPFTTQARTGLASERRAAASQTQKGQNQVVSSRSAASGLDKLLASEDYETSFGDDDFIAHKWQAETEKPSAKALKPARAPPGPKAPEPSASGLEDLMGDLMAEMEKKAEISSERLKTKARTPVRPEFRIPEASGSSPKFSRIGSETRSNKTNHNDPNPTPRMQGRGPATGLEPPVPESPDIKPSDSISQWGFTRSPSPTFVKALQLAPTASDDLCQRCGEAPIRRQKNSTTDESRFCRGCYADLYLPKCRKCSEPIEGGAVTDRVGKVLGKYHARCFNCFQCSAPFPTGDFYVWERKPVCSKHYHRLAGTICCNESCGSGIEGPCVSLILDGSSAGSVASDGSSEPGSISNSARRRLYHPEHFTCARRGCRTSLHEFHFVVKGQPWCEEHALQEEDPGQWRSQPSERGPPVSPYPRDRSAALDRSRLGRNGPVGLPHPARRMERRRTVIQNVQNR